MSEKNLGLWESVQRTDPKHTKKVNQRGGFTAIDAYWQIHNATEKFGPVGVGWGWHVENTIITDNQVFVVHLNMWHGDTNRKHNFDVFGAAELVSSKGRVDADAPKKALTDAITKGLSYLGFNADVFLGRFDDNKYVQGVEQDIANEQLEQIMVGLNTCKTEADIVAFRNMHSDLIRTLPSAQKDKLKNMVAHLRDSFATETEPG